MKRAILILACVVLLAGCFPITVSVAPDGRIALVREEGVVVYDLAKGEAKLVAKPAGDTKAAWVQFSADGKKLFYVTTRENTPGTVFVTDASGGAAKELYKGDSPMAWALWSPDGKYISVGEVATQSKGDLGNLVAVKAIAVDTGKVTDILDDSVMIHDWTPDSKAIVAVVVKAKAGDQEKGGGNVLKGTLTLFTLDGKQTPIAEVIAGKDLSVDVFGRRQGRARHRVGGRKAGRGADRARGRRAERALLVLDREEGGGEAGRGARLVRVLLARQQAHRPRARPATSPASSSSAATGRTSRRSRRASSTRARDSPTRRASSRRGPETTRSSSGRTASSSAPPARPSPPCGHARRQASDQPPGAVRAAA